MRKSVFPYATVVAAAVAGPLRLQGGVLAQGRDGTQATADARPCRCRRGHQLSWL
jgi:hypothetical protein